MSFKHRTCLYWFEFAPILKRAQRSGRSIRIYAPSEHLHLVTIVDGEKPARDGHDITGIGGDDWMRDAIVCNSGWFNGCIPMKSIQGATWENEDGSTGVRQHIRGVVGTLDQLLSEGIIRKTSEVRELMGC